MSSKRDKDDRSYRELIREARSRLGFNENDYCLEDEDLEDELSEQEEYDDSLQLSDDPATHVEDFEDFEGDWTDFDPHELEAESEGPGVLDENVYSFDDYRYQTDTKGRGTRASGADKYRQGGGKTFKKGKKGVKDYESFDDFVKSKKSASSEYTDKESGKTFSDFNAYLDWKYPRDANWGSAFSFGSGGNWKAAEKWKSAGGVVLHGLSGVELNYIYVVKPSKNYGPWTLPKGKVDKDETPEQAAVREVKEEAGLKAKILPNGKLGEFEGSFSKTTFFMMVRTGGSPLIHDDETEEVRAVTLDQALDLFKSSGNKRDSAVIEKAREFIDGLKTKLAGKR